MQQLVFRIFLDLPIFGGQNLNYLQDIVFLIEF